MGIAAQVAAWGKEWPKASMGPLGLQAGISPNTFGDGQSKLGIIVEILINGVWTDISSYVLYENKVRISRGKGRESNSSSPAQMTLTLKNPDKRFSPRNPNGPYFGYLGRNVKIRASVNPGSNVYKQFQGRVSEWPQKIITGEARFVSITASGILRRLQQGDSPIKSAVERATTMASPVALWRMNDVATSPGELAESLGGGSNLVAVSNPLGSTVTGPAGAPDQFPELMQSDTTTRVAYKATVTAHTGNNWTLDFIAKGSAGPAALTSILPLEWRTGGMTWTVQMTSDGSQVIVAGTPRNVFGGVFGATISMTANVDIGQAWHHYRITAEQVGASLNTSLYVDFGGSAFVNFPDDSDSAPGTSGGVSDITVDFQTSNADTDSASIGYITIYSGLTGSNDVGNATGGWDDELATDRFERLCTEEGIDFVIVDLVPQIDNSSSLYMGPQTVSPLVTLLQECADVVEGALDEDLDDNLRLTTHTASWDQAARLVLDYNTQLLNVDDFDPTDDDKLIRNDWTISRTQSGSNPQQFELTSGPMNVNEPEDDPEGVGRYNDSASLNLAAVNGDNMALNHAAYRVAKGTIDAVRFDSLPLWLEIDPGFIIPWMSQDPVGARVLVLNSPDDIGGGTADQNINGYDVVMDQFTYHITMNTVPNDVYKTGSAELQSATSTAEAPPPTKTWTRPRLASTWPSRPMRRGSTPPATTTSSVMARL
jgi:hypothetical protein